MEVRGITISVNYSSLLEITLVRNMRHLTECVVVTSPEDVMTQSLCLKVPGVRVLVTDAFTRFGARFNKGLAMEEGLDFLGRYGYLLIWDADILFPESIPFDQFKHGRLYGANRRMCEDPARWTPDVNWRQFPNARDGGPVGFTQFFHADDPAVKDKRPWYDVSFAHAGGGDAYFMSLWPPGYKSILPMEVLHLGPRDTHWFGTDPEARDLMSAFVARNGWSRPRGLDPTAVQRVGEIQERVQVPGYEPSDFELPFVRRGLAARQNQNRRTQ